MFFKNSIPILYNAVFNSQGLLDMMFSQYLSSSINKFRYKKLSISHITIKPLALVYAATVKHKWKKRNDTNQVVTHDT